MIATHHKTCAECGRVIGNTISALCGACEVERQTKARMAGLSQGAAGKPYENQMQREPMRLNLGSSDHIINGYVNVDIADGPGIDKVVDLTCYPWPWADGSVEEILAHDIIEHLPEKILTMNEMWRVLKVGATAEIVVPTTDGPGAFQDPTHVSFWNRRSFLYYEKGSPYRERFAKAYGISAAFKVVRENITRTIDGPKLGIVLEKVL